MLNKNRVAVISTGNGGQSFAGYFAYKGAEVTLYAREAERVEMFKSNRFLLDGVVNAEVEVALISDSMKDVLSDARLVMVTTPSHYYEAVARSMAPYLEDGQIVVLNPGRTFGTYGFLTFLRDFGCRADITLAETDTFIFTCRAERPGHAHIYHIKPHCCVAAHIPERVGEVTGCLREYFDSIIPRRSVFETAFANIGMVFHPLPVLMNLTRIEYKEKFLYYHGAITPLVADVLTRLDAERVAVAVAAGVATQSAFEWLGDRYGSIGNTLYERIQNTDAYSDIFAPQVLDTRYVMEDVRTGCVPIAALGRALGVETPTINATIAWASAVYDIDFYADGRNEQRIDIDNLISDLRAIQQKQAQE